MIEKKPAFWPKVVSVSDTFGCRSVQVGFQADPDPLGMDPDMHRTNAV
jgi:hypothetical protein